MWESLHKDMNPGRYGVFWAIFENSYQNKISPDQKEEGKNRISLRVAVMYSQRDKI